MTPPRLKALKKGVAHGRFSYTEEEKKKYNTDTAIFAYMRRSTSKEEQADSLEKQGDCIDLIIKKHGIDDKMVVSFIETRSGFENRKRPQFDAMMKAIDKLKIPCTLLAYDSSRLSRNQKDSREIVDRIFGDNGAKKKIQEIIFHEDRSWDTQSNKDEVYQTLLDNYKESVHTGKRSRDGSLKQLRNGIYTWGPPKGLEHVKNGKTILYMRQNDLMPIVRKAFEMKMAGTTHKKIAKYLKEHGIKTGERDLNERYFSNTIYIGNYGYTDKTTGEVTEYPVKFFEGKPPISATLWQGVQENRGKKKDTYGDKQPSFTLGEIMRTEEGRRLSGYFQKGTKQYKNTTESIHISEKWVVKEYVEYLRNCIYKLILKKRSQNLDGSSEKILSDIIDCQEFSFGSIRIKRLTEIFETREIPHDQSLNREKESKEFKKKGNACNVKHSRNEHFFDATAQHDYIDLCHLAQDFDYYQQLFPKNTKKDWDKIVRMTQNREHAIDMIKSLYHEKFDYIDACINDFASILGDLSLGSAIEHKEELISIKTDKQVKISELEKETQKINNDIKDIKRNYLRIASIDGMEVAFKEEIASLEQRKRVIIEELEELENEKDLDEIIAKIPDILSRTFELASKVFTGKENKDLKDDIYDLIKLTTFELKIKKKKALEIELFGPVKQVLFGGDAVLEAPPGVEPGYEALQAPT